MCHSKRRMRGDDNATHVGKARWRREEGEEGWLGHGEGEELNIVL